MVYFGMCGCGGFVERVVLPMMEKTGDARPVAVFDVNAESMDRVCGKFNIPTKCNSFEELLTIKEVSAVYIATPNVFHKEQTVKSAIAGKHVFCQKPLGLNADECRGMIDVCRRAGVKLGVGFCYRFHGAQQRAKELVKEGIIGEVSYIYISFNLSDYNPQTVGWRCNPRISGGGPLVDLVPHLIDLACFFLDDKVESVMAYVRPDKTDTEIETDVLAILQFYGGARASIDSSFVRGNLYNYSIVGTAGEIRAYGTMPWLTDGNMVGRLTLEKGGNVTDINFPGIEHVEEELRLYCQALEKDEEPPVPGEAGLHVHAVIDAIYKSGRTGKRCNVRY